jgi:predicted lactoylglutathione lyase
MQINNVLASLPVKDLAPSRVWYEKLFGRAPDSSPMPTLAECRFSGGGCLQVYVGPDRAGGGSCTLAVGDIQASIEALKKLGIDTGTLISSDKAKVVMINDPDGNTIAIAQAMEASFSR